MKYYVIAGEASGDLHGAKLIQQLMANDPQATIRFWGGDKMQAAGGKMVKHYKELAFMGFWEVIKNLRTILNNLAFCKKDIAAFSPDVIIYIDYPGFNMRIAQWARKQGYRNHYYISPQIWAWKENRIKKIKRDLDELYVILPFETDYYREKHQHDVTFVGHPLVEIIAEEEEKPFDDAFPFLLPDQQVVALLPGSRKQEIEKMMPLFLEVATAFPQHQFVIAAAPGIPVEWYAQFTQQAQIHLVHQQTYSLLRIADAALVTSGTATLETALFGIPQLVCYRSSWISYWIAKRVVKLEYISLVNLILNKAVVPELIQGQCNVDEITQQLNALFTDAVQTKMKADYDRIKTVLGKNKASALVAQKIRQALD